MKSVLLHIFSIITHMSVCAYEIADRRTDEKSSSSLISKRMEKMHTQT